jgi:hypothetical protein
VLVSVLVLVLVLVLEASSYGVKVNRHFSAARVDFN